jgi:hypothetical protein
MRERNEGDKVSKVIKERMKENCKLKYKINNSQLSLNDVHLSRMIQILVVWIGFASHRTDSSDESLF